MSLPACPPCPKCKENYTYQDGDLLICPICGFEAQQQAWQAGETVTTEVAKRDELHTFKVIPKRWVVERSFAWLEKNRRLWKNCERHLNSSLQFTNLAFIALLLKRL